MKKTLIQIGIVCVLVIAPYEIFGKPKDTRLTDRQQIELLTLKTQELDERLGEVEGIEKVLWARTQELHEQVLKLQGDPSLDKAVYKVQAELNDVDARVSQLERPEVDDEAK